MRRLWQRLVEYRIAHPGLRRDQILLRALAKSPKLLLHGVHHSLQPRWRSTSPDAPLRRGRTEGSAEKPSIIIAALPRSGSQYVTATLMRRFGYQAHALWVGEFPNGVVKRPLARAFGAGGLIVDGPLRCNPANIRRLRRHGLTKIALHVRDPRASVWSQMRSPPSGPAGFARLKLSREAFSALNYEQQLDRFIDAVLCDSVAWLDEWTAFLDAGADGMEIRVMRHEQLIADEEAYFQRVSEFYGLEPQAETLGQNPTGAACGHSGRTEAWREAVSPAQLACMTEMIPQRLFQRFSWHR